MDGSEGERREGGRGEGLRDQGSGRGGVGAREGVSWGIRADVFDSKDLKVSAFWASSAREGGHPGQPDGPAAAPLVARGQCRRERDARCET